MFENVLSGLVGAIVGAILTWILSRRIAKETVKDESKASLVDNVRIELAKNLLSYLSRVLNREAPEIIRDTHAVIEIRRDWALLHRQLFLVNVPDEEREKFDDRMVEYLESLAKWVNDPDQRPEVERQRAKTKQAALDFLLRLGMAIAWDESE